MIGSGEQAKVPRGQVIQWKSLRGKTQREKRFKQKAKISNML
jgi:hypothetical protein